MFVIIIKKPYSKSSVIDELETIFIRNTNAFTNFTRIFLPDFKLIAKLVFELPSRTGKITIGVDSAGRVIVTLLFNDSRYPDRIIEKSRIRTRDDIRRLAMNIETTLGSLRELRPSYYVEEL